jgi:hypothetical protein
VATTQMTTVTSQAIFGSGTAGYSREGPMTPAPTPRLSPELAADYLRELSADIRAVAVLTAAGEPVAGSAELAAAARELLAAAPAAAEIEVELPGGAVFAARDDRHALVAACGRFALPALIRYDLKVVLAELAGEETSPARRAAA